MVAPPAPRLDANEGEVARMARSMMSKSSPQMPQGVEVAAFRSHKEATAAVERLAENQFPLASVTIVGSDLHLAEKVLGRLTPAKIALSGATQGLTWGLMMAVFSILFYPQSGALIPLVMMSMGVLLGVLIATISWAVRKDRSSFAATSTMVASRYAILVGEMADRAFTLLAHMPGNLIHEPRRPVRREAPPAPKSTSDQEWTAVSVEVEEQPQTSSPASPSEYGSRPDEKPRFGVRLSDREGDQD